MSIMPPKNLEENKRWRIDMLQKAQNNKELQGAINAKCKESWQYFIDGFCFTFDPRLENAEIPFVLYPKQEQFITWLEEMRGRAEKDIKVNAVIDKPRDVGATYTFMAWCLWRYLFHEFSARIGSRKEDYVDKKGEPDTLFYKLDFMLDRLPEWMTGQNNRASMILNRKGETNQISGESANPNFSRGGRKTVVLFDELAFWDWARSSWESSGESTNFRIALSTPPEAGRDSFFYKLLTGKSGQVEKFNFDWTDVPKRDAKWLQQAQLSKSPEEFAREVLKSFEATTEGKVYAKTLQQAKMGEYDYDPQLPLFVSWDFGRDQVAMIWMQKNMQTGELYWIDSYHNEDKELDFYVPFVTGEIESGIHSYDDRALEIIERHKHWSKTITHFGDPDIKKHNLQTKDSNLEFLAKKGIYVQHKDWGGRKWKDHRNITQMIFRRLHINEKRNEYAIGAIRNARYPKRTENSQSMNEPLKPIHDYTSHYRSSLEYFADNEPTLKAESSVDTIREYRAKMQLAKMTR